MEENAIDMCPRCFERGFRDPQTIAQMLGGATEHEARAAQAGGTNIRWELRKNDGALNLFLVWNKENGQPCERWRASFSTSKEV